MIEVGLVGFGLAGRYFHAPVIRAVPGLCLSAILQRSGVSAAQTYPDVRMVRNLDELLATDAIRLIVVATPNQSHFPIAKRCLEAGRDVVVDKPFTVSVAEAVELLQLARKLGRILSVYHDRRFDADFHSLRKLVAAGELGRTIRFEDTYDRYRPLPKPGAWREQPGPGNGIFFDLSPHLFDQAFMLLGQPTALTADIRTERRGMATDDAFDVLLHYPEGARALLRATMLCANPRPRMVVMGEKGTYLKRTFDPLENSLRNAQIPQGDSWVLETQENWGEVTLVENDKATTHRVPSAGDWREFYANVRDAILGKAALEVTPQHALDVMVAIELAMESSDKRTTVHWRNIQF
jgi:scyllo-inositol 2-dehydrogenase (NADP+)